MPRQSLKSAAPRPGRFPAFGRRSAQTRKADPVRMPDFRRRLSTWLVFLFAAAVLTSPATAAAMNTNLFRLGFSAQTFSDVNENDAMAALKVWARVIAKERGIPMDPAPRVLKGVEEIAQAARGKVIDALALPTDEYWKVRDALDARVFITGLNEGQITEEYVLLVHQDSGIKQVEDLHGRRLAFFQNSRMSLAPVWLDTALVQAGFPRGAEFCRVTQGNKLPKVILSVFFRQTDACVVTRRGFKTMNELNPQMSQRLKVLASSPAVVPSGFSFRRDYDDPIRETIIKELGKIISTPAGAQVLTLFQSGSLQAQPISCLDSAFELLVKHRRLCGETNTGTTGKGSAKTLTGAK